MNVVVVGTGLAAAQAAQELRAQGHTGDITLVGSEPHRPYERPPLSKGLLLGTAEPDSVHVHPPTWYADEQVELLTGAPVTAIDLDTRRVTVAGRQLSYDRLLLATGARPRRLPEVEASGAEVHHLRTLEDALALAPRLTAHLLVVGGGWIGLEVAAAAREAGGTVTVVEPSALPLARVLGAEVAPVFADLHRDHGVDLRLGTRLTGIEHRHGRTTAHLDDGSAVTPDLVLVAVGAEPEDALAADAGLATDHGVLVDAGLRASDPHVFAAGDVALHDHPLHGRLRVEHWDTAIHQGRHAARAMLGADEPYVRQPYFFTDQYDLGMEYVGHVGARGYDEVIVRGSLADRRFTALWLGGGRVAAGMQVNDWDATSSIRELVGRRTTPAVRDTSVTLEDACASQREQDDEAGAGMGKPGRC